MDKFFELIEDIIGWFDDRLYGWRHWLRNRWYPVKMQLRVWKSKRLNFYDRVGNWWRRGKPKKKRFFMGTGDYGWYLVVDGKRQMFKYVGFSASDTTRRHVCKYTSRLNHTRPKKRELSEVYGWYRLESDSALNAKYGTAKK